MNPHNEIVFETDIVKALTLGGYSEGQPEKYDVENALYPDDLIGYFKATQSERCMTKYSRRWVQTRPTSISAVKLHEEAIDNQGSLHSLRRGVRRVRRCQIYGAIQA